MKKQIHKFYIKNVASLSPSLLATASIFIILILAFSQFMANSITKFVWNEEIIVIAWFTRVVNPSKEERDNAQYI